MSQSRSATAEGHLFQELATQEKALNDAQEVVRLARNDLEMATRKYAAVRSLVTEVLGYSPYHEDAVWATEGAAIVPSGQRGHYRFLQMKPREAIIAALAEQGAELTLPQIEERLRSGGLELGLRAINAALMRTAGVLKTARGTYRLIEKRGNGRAA